MSRSGGKTPFVFHCPHDGAAVEWDITPERVSIPPLVDVQGVLCPMCHRDLSSEVWQAINAPAFLAHHVLEYGDSLPPGNSANEEHWVIDYSGFWDFRKNWCAVREIFDGAEYLSEEERSILQDRYGFQNRRALSYRALGHRYSRSARGIQDLLHRIFRKVLARSGGALASLLQSRGDGQDLTLRSGELDGTPLLLSVAEAAKRTGLSRYRIYQVGRFDKVADPIADAPKGGWLVFACPLDRKPKTERSKNSRHGTFFVTSDSLEAYCRANRAPGPKGVNTKSWRKALLTSNGIITPDRSPSSIRKS